MRKEKMQVVLQYNSVVIYKQSYSDFGRSADQNYPPVLLLFIFPPLSYADIHRHYSASSKLDIVQGNSVGALQCTQT